MPVYFFIRGRVSEFHKTEPKTLYLLPVEFTIAPPPLHLVVDRSFFVLTTKLISDHSKRTVIVPDHI